MNYDKMTIKSLVDDCFNRSGYKINKVDLESRIQHLCDKYHQDKLDNLSQHLVSLCTYVVKDFQDGLNYMNSSGEWTKHKQFAKIYTEIEAKTIAKINEGRTKLYKG